MTTAATGKQKIAILGGGMASLAAAFELTKTAGWQDRYEITVYQMGWRLGGKGASGRNRDKADRIEEHGLHIWMGMYENAFRLMRDCYAELGRPAGSPLATWTDAFKKHSLTTMMEEVDGEWIPWSFNVATNDDVPGDGGVCLSPFNMVRRLIQWMEESFEQGGFCVCRRDGARPNGYVGGIRESPATLWHGQSVVPLIVHSLAACRARCPGVAQSVLRIGIRTRTIFDR